VGRTIGLDELYWGTTLTIQEIGDRLGLTTDNRTTTELWRLVAPVEAGAMCPYCGADLLYRNRQRRKVGRAECEHCAHDTGIGRTCSCGGCSAGRSASDRAQREAAHLAFVQWDESCNTPDHLVLVWSDLPHQTQTIFRALRSLLAQASTVSWTDVAAAARTSTTVVDVAIDHLRLTQLIKVNPSDGQFQVNMHPIPAPLRSNVWTPPQPYGRYKSIDPLAALLEDADGIRSDDDYWAILCLLDDRFDDLLQRTSVAARTFGRDVRQLWYGTSDATGVCAELNELLEDVVQRHGAALGDLHDCAHRVLRASLRVDNAELQY
jgi:predicted RNA-binding Zn-ribbon protein involved in translation (DUF1610 family)